MSSEKFCLKWNEFQTNIISSYKDLREDGDFADVTLVCEGNQKIEAHKVILSSASNFFRSVFTGNTHLHPLIYMRNVKNKELAAILDFIYKGEVFVDQDDLNGFLELSEELEIKGLTGKYVEKEDNKFQSAVNAERQNEKFSENIFENTTTNLSEYNEEKPTISESKTVSTIEGSYTSEAKKSTSFRDDNSELDKLVNSMLAKVDGLWTCTKCGKTNNDKTMAKRHIETHIEGVSHPCGFCGKTLRSRNCLKVHISRTHTK